MTNDPTVANNLSPRNCLTVDSMRSVSQAIELMDGANTSVVSVLSRGHIYGLFTQSDLVKRVLRKGLDPEFTDIGNVMTRNPITVAFNCTLWNAFTAMTQNKISHLPVIDNTRKFLGVITEDDLRDYVKSFTDQTTQAYMMVIKYIGGEPYGANAA